MFDWLKVEGMVFPGAADPLDTETGVPKTDEGADVCSLGCIVDAEDGAVDCVLNVVDLLANGRGRGRGA